VGVKLRRVGLIAFASAAYRSSWRGRGVGRGVYIQVGKRGWLGGDRAAALRSSGWSPSWSSLVVVCHPCASLLGGRGRAMGPAATYLRISKGCGAGGWV